METITFNGKQIRCLKDSENYYFMGIDIASILQYKDTNQAIRKNVCEQDKIKLMNLNIPQFYKTHPETIFINKRGVITLLQKSKKVLSTDLVLFFKNKFNITVDVY